MGSHGLLLWGLTQKRKKQYLKEAMKEVEYMRLIFHTCRSEWLRSMNSLVVRAGRDLKGPLVSEFSNYF